MKAAAKKLNFMITAEVAQELEKLVPPGKRSGLVTEAIRHELERLRRAQLTERLTILREEGPVYDPKALGAELKKDRERDR